MRVLVTGGLGFLGHAVTRRLVDGGHEVTALTSHVGARSSVEGASTVSSDIRNRDTMASVVDDVRPDAVCHLAALTRVRDSFLEPTRYYDVNVGGTVALLDALSRVAPVRFVFASTGAIYGPREGRITEDQATAPANPYGASKLAAEQLIAYQAATGALGAVVLRCFNIAGAVDRVTDADTTRILPKALAVAAGAAECLSINGDGSAIREFTHVADVAAAVDLALSAAEVGKAEVFNTGSGIGTTMRDVVEAVERITGRPVAVEHQPPKPEPAILMADSTRLRQRLGWRPTYDIDTIIRDAWSVIDR